MVFISVEDKEQVCEALRLAVIFMQESPREDSPIREVRKALEVMSSASARLE